MTGVEKVFCDAKPKAIDFPQLEYEKDMAAFDRIAAQHGYRLAGIRLGRVVFTSKPRAPDAP